VTSVSRTIHPALTAKAAELCVKDVPDASDLQVDLDLHELVRDLRVRKMHSATHKWHRQNIQLLIA
jgi:hypothetical protein